MSPRSLINGLATDCLSVADRGLMYGDGVFRTLKVRAGQAIWWQAHLEKLADDCTRLGLHCHAPDLWLADLHACRLTGADAVVKLIVTRGAGARGYRPAAQAEATRIVMAAPMPEAVLGVAEEGARVRICNLRLGQQPLLAGIKHLNRLENVLAQREWNDPAIHEGLLFDQSGHLVSGTKSNVFLVRRGGLLTPRLDRCGVAGVTRARLIEFARSAGIEVTEAGALTLEDVLSAEEILLCNSLIGLWRVARLDDRVWDVPVLFHGLLAGLHD
jgi:4-amino-4-deoxychorismate lyase